MPTDDQSPGTPTAPTTPKDAASNNSQKPTGWFEVPEPVKRVFDQYPLLAYTANTLPLRGPRSTKQHILHVFTTDQDARDGRPSFNPSCLRWQVRAYTPYKTYIRPCEGRGKADIETNCRRT